jgi:hypothetical protein
MISSTGDFGHVSSDQAVAAVTPWDSDRRFKFQKRRQLFFRSPNDTLSVVAVCVNNPARSPFKIQS